MRVLRTLAALIGRMFDRLARMLLRWSRGPEAGEPDAAGWTEASDHGPPEHWIRHIRQRAPWLVRGSRAAPSGVPLRWTASPVRQRGQPVRPAPAPEPARAAGEHPRMLLSPPERPTAPPEAGDARAPHVETRHVEANHAAVIPAATVSIPVSSPVRPVVRRGGAPVGARVTAPSTGQARESVSAGAVIEPAEVRQPPGVKFPGPAPLGRGEPAMVHTELPGPVAGRGAPLSLDTEDAAAPWPDLPVRARAENSGAPAPDASASWTAASEGRKDSGARAEGQRAAPGQTEFQEAHRWPDLPEPRSRGEAWEAPSSRLREREQLRLTRLRAEQAGSSWSGLHS